MWSVELPVDPMCPAVLTNVLHTQHSIIVVFRVSGKVVSIKKEELIHILDQFNIQVQ